MRIITSARIGAAFIIACALVFTTISLFTCHWLDFQPFDYSKGLFSQSSCTFYDSSPAWNTATFALMIAAFACEIILILFVLTTSFLRHSHNHLINVDILLCFLIFATQTAALITFGISATNYWEDRLSTYYKLSWSFWLVIPGAALALLAIGPLTHAITVIHKHGADEHWHF